MLKLVSSGVAQKNIQSAVDYYDKIQPALADAFLTALWKCYDLIEAFPMIFPEHHDDIHVAVISGFTQRVYYKIYADKIVILAVLHSSQDEEPFLKPLNDEE